MANQPFHREPSRTVPLVEETDVLVCGAGPAGVAAALAAARSGAKTRLIEVHGCLGGVWTAGLLCWIIDHGNKPGIMAEITARLRAAGAVSDARSGSYGYDVEAMKRLLEEMCLEAGIDVRLHTRVCAAAIDERNKLAVAITESKSGREAWAAKAFVDASGEGDLAAQAGCGFDIGREGTGEMQPMSLIGLLTGIDREAVIDFVNNGPAPYPSAKRALLAELQRAGVDPSYHGPTLFHIRDDLFCLMANHEYGVSGMNADELTAATIRARAEVNGMVDALRALGDPWSDLRLVATAEQIGVREGRRIHGRYEVTFDDMLNGARHDDAVCRVTFGIDVHSTNPAKTQEIERKPEGKTQPYDIPLRALIARDVDGLLLAGRCISGDFLAHSSYRVTGNAVAMGQAAGVTAALAAEQNEVPHKVAWADVSAGIERVIEAAQAGVEQTS